MPTIPTAIARHAAFTVMLLAWLALGCRSGTPPVPVTVVDLIKEFERADRRPPAGYALADHMAAGTALPSIMGPAPGRITWTLPLPRHGTFRVRVAATGGAARIRIGVSDTRVYEELTGVLVQPDSGWTTIGADLSAYAGHKLSLFYRPERQQWRLNLSADAPAGTPAEIAWGVPEILAPPGADALEYAKRRASIRNEAP